ncbi:MAG: hypothetical protein ACOC9D_06725 [Thermodesulfobacteriota bacterium]
MTPFRQPKPMAPELQVKEAKVRLRAAAGRMSPGSFYRKDPRLALGLAFSAGVILGLFRKSGREAAALLEEAAGICRALNCKKLIQQLFQAKRGDRS